MIVAGTGPIYIDLGKDEPGMTLQRFDGRVWGDYLVDGKPVLSPVDSGISNDRFAQQRTVTLCEGL